MSLSGIGNSLPYNNLSWPTKADPSTTAQSSSAENNNGLKQRNNNNEPNLEKERVVNELRERDAEVRRHEQAHLAAAGGLSIGGAQYDMQIGPDGKSYAVGGEVSIDTSPVANDPEATLQKANTIRAAALAPANPSPQDMKVAAQATQMEANAQRELAEQKQAERQEQQKATGYNQLGTPQFGQAITLGLNIVG